MSDNNNGKIHNNRNNDTHEAVTEVVIDHDKNKNFTPSTPSEHVTPTATTQASTSSATSASTQPSTNISTNGHSIKAKDENNPMQSAQKTESGATDYDAKDDDNVMSSPPKRNTSAYFIYNTAMMAQFKKEYPDMSFGQLAKHTSQMYKNLALEEKATWEERAAKDKARYQTQMSNHISSQDRKKEDNEERHPLSTKRTRSNLSTTPVQDANNSTQSTTNIPLTKDDEKATMTNATNEAIELCDPIQNDANDNNDDDNDCKDMHLDDEKDMDQIEENERAPAIEDQKDVAITVTQIEDSKSIKEEKSGSSWSWNNKTGIIIKLLWYKNLNELALDPKHTSFEWNWLHISLKNAVKEYNSTQAEEHQQHFDSLYLQNFAVTTARFTWLGDDAMGSKTYERPPDDPPTIPTEEWINWYKNNIYLKIINHEYMVRATTNTNNANNNVVDATSKRPTLNNFLSDAITIKGLENLLITACDGVNSWAGSLAYGNRISWFNDNTSSFFLKGGCLDAFDTVSPRQLRAKFRVAEKIAKEQYKEYKNNRTNLPTWVKLFFDFFDKSRYLSISASTTPTKINDNENNLNDMSTVTPCTSTATLAHRIYDSAVQQTNISNVSAPIQQQNVIDIQQKAIIQKQQMQEEQIVITPYAQIQGNTIQEAVAEAIVARQDSTNINHGTLSESAAIRPRSPSPIPLPNTRRKTSDDSNTLNSEQQQQVSTNNNSCNNQLANQFIPTAMQPPVISMRPFTQIFADAMMVRQRLNASLTLNNNDDVRFYKKCLDAIESEIDTYKYLQISIRHVQNNNNNNNSSNNSNSRRSM